jgi:hypothetical protein
VISSIAVESCMKALKIGLDITRAALPQWEALGLDV